MLNTLPFIVRPRSALLYAVCITTLTHLACVLMIMAPVVAWYVCYPKLWIFKSVFYTVIPFYFIFVTIGKKDRLIRRPPASFLNNG